MDADNRYTIPGPETKGFISHNKSSSVPECQVYLPWFPMPHKAHGGNTKMMAVCTCGGLLYRRGSVAECRESTAL